MIRVHGNDNTPIIHVNSDPVRNVNVTVNSSTSTQRSIGTQTIYGPAGQDGEDGFSPIATVEKVDDVTTITITDINGTTTAEVYDGTQGLEDVQVNGNSVVSDDVANIELKTINSNSIVGTGDLEIIAGVSDVQVDGASVVTSGVAEITMPSIPPAQVNSDWNAASGVAEILNKPSIPTVNNATLTLTQGGVTKGTFTANASSDTTIDLDAGGGSGSSRNIGEIVQSTIPLTDAGLHLLDGSQLQYGSYQAFIDYIADLYNDDPTANYFAQAGAVDIDFVQPTLSTNGTIGGDSFAVNATSEYSSSYQAWQAFDGDNSTSWLVAAPASLTFPTDLIIYNPVAIKCSNIAVTTRSTYASTFTAGVVYGSNDNSIWNEITTFANDSTAINSQYNIRLYNNKNYYKYYKISFTAGRNDSGTATASYGIAEINLTATYKDETSTAEQYWQQQVTNYGVCGKFVYNSVNQTVRLPKITGIIEGTTDLTALSDLVQAGLPNITGSAGGRYYGGGNTDGTNVSGAIIKGTESKFLFGSSTSTSTYYGGFGIDASESSSIYGNSSTVQPQTIKVFYYIVIATSTKTQIEVDIDEIATDLNGKADVDFLNCNYTPAKTDLSNLSATGQKVLDGGWVYSYSELTTATTLGSRTHSLASYLPDANFDYEVLFYVHVTSTNSTVLTIGRASAPYTNSSDNDCAAVMLATGNNGSHNDCAVTYMISKTNQNIYSQISGAAANSSAFVRALAYRRLGTNS